MRPSPLFLAPHPLYRVDTVVLGSGCAGFNAADSLYDLGVRDLCLVTEGLSMGTSRNTGSDKQTYYKLTLSGGEEDSVRRMAQTLFQGGGVHGDIALCEAAGSARGFLKLCGLGVPFPTNAYGEYVGYKTDHDPARRATSAGPLTSKYMTEALERSVRSKPIPILDQAQAVELFAPEGRLEGLLCLDKQTGGLFCIQCRFLVLCTGGPAGIYGQSVYPASQLGGSGLAIAAGAAMENLDLWQYGLASLDFRWNVSGSYQQVLPRIFSVDDKGVEREFLLESLRPEEALLYAFQKGYQWPFDVRKRDLSSRIDLLVHEQTLLGREVYLDFRRNPSGYSFADLPEEAKTYLANSGCVQETPFLRLQHMNPQAVALYLDHGIDLESQPLRVGVCAQHQNGGVAIDANWQSSVEGLYAAGEAAASFGVVRPGGSALNATQVGSLRAAEHIARRPRAPFADPAPLLEACGALERGLTRAEGNRGLAWSQALERLRREMSLCCAHARNEKRMAALLDWLNALLDKPFASLSLQPGQAAGYLRTLDLCTAAAAVLQASLFAAERFGSRGSCLYAAHPDEVPGMEGSLVRTQRGESRLVPVRPLPEPDDWFENVWRDYRARTQRS